MNIYSCFSHFLIVLKLILRRWVAPCQLPWDLTLCRPLPFLPHHTSILALALSSFLSCRPVSSRPDLDIWLSPHWKTSRDRFLGSLLCGDTAFLVHVGYEPQSSSSSFPHSSGPAHIQIFDASSVPLAPGPSTPVTQTFTSLEDGAPASQSTGLCSSASNPLGQVHLP